MKCFFLYPLLAFSFMLTSSLACDEEAADFLPLYKASLGPEFYHVKRTREGGASQSGGMIGVRGSFERIGRYKWYLGVEGLYGTGTIKGHAGSGAKIKSKLSDYQIEGRLGYTFQAKCGFRPALTPFVGYGYWEETNHYKFPSPLLVKFSNQAPYVSFGFLSTITICPQFTAGFNFKARALIDSECRVKNDPVFGHLKMYIHDEMQYRFELPLYYDYYCNCRVFELGLVPFYEYRHYGGRENYPFDFLDTKLRIYGINIQFTYRF